MLPGVLLAVFFQPDLALADIWFGILQGIVAACLACSVLLFVNLPDLRDWFTPLIEAPYYGVKHTKSVVIRPAIRFTSSH